MSDCPHLATEVIQTMGYEWIKCLLCGAWKRESTFWRLPKPPEGL